MSTDIKIHSYTNGGFKGQRPRIPMVQLLASNGYGDVDSIVFHAADAHAVAKAIIEAGRAASAGRMLKAVKITFKETGS